MSVFSMLTRMSIRQGTNFPGDLPALFFPSATQLLTLSPAPAVGRCMLQSSAARERER